MLEVEQMFGCLDIVSCWSKKEEDGRTNQNLSFWGSSGQSEAQLLGTIGATLTGFHTKPPIMPIFSGFRSVYIHYSKITPLKAPFDLFRYGPTNMIFMSAARLFLPVSSP